MNDGLGKKAENKIKEWLDRPEDGYSFDRIPDQMTGFYASCNICDFTCFKSPYYFYIESKATWNDRFDFSMITDYQRKHMLEKSRIQDVYALVIVLFATYQRAFIIPIEEFDKIENSGKKSININKVNSWNFRFYEIPTILNNRKKLLNYSGELDIMIRRMYCEETS